MNFWTKLGTTILDLLEECMVRKICPLESPQPENICSIGWCKLGFGAWTAIPDDLLPDHYKRGDFIPCPVQKHTYNLDVMRIRGKFWWVRRMNIYR